MMDSFFRSSSSRSHRPSLADSNNENVINNEEICIMDQEDSRIIDHKTKELLVLYYLEGTRNIELLPIRIITFTV
jgi:hypothetical protein